MQTGMLNCLFYILRPNANLKKCVCISGQQLLLSN